MQPTKILSRNGAEVSFQTGDGGSINLSNGHSDTQGFFITLAPDATEGLLSVKPWNSNEFKLLPFFKGRNPILLKEVRNDAGNTATNAYWEK